MILGAAPLGSLDSQLGAASFASSSGVLLIRFSGESMRSPGITDLGFGIVQIDDDTFAVPEIGGSDFES